MKINPPKAKISEEKPFEDALFGREEFANSLTTLLRNAEDNLVIFVNAPWGAGKTTFSEMWRAYLKQQKLEVIYFDAYAADYFDDPFVSFSGAILELVDKRLNEGKGLVERDDFKEKAIEVGKRLGGLALKVGLRAATLNVIELADLAKARDVASEIATGVSELGAEVIEKKIDNYSKETEALDNFKKSLAKLAAKIREEQGFPLTIIVDELDRCRPDFALGLLEKIKHLFDVEGVAFVLLVNREQIEKYIQTVYGNADTRDYLLKFGNLFIDLPNQQPLFSGSYEKGLKEYGYKLLSHHGFSERLRDSHFFVLCMEIFAGHFDLSLRELEKTFTIMAVYYSSITSGESQSEMLTALLAVLKVKRPLLYRSLSRGSIASEQFFQETSFDQLTKKDGQGFNWARQKDLLDLCLLPDAEFEKATKKESGDTSFREGLARLKEWWGYDRKNIIPKICSRLDRFSFNP